MVANMSEINECLDLCRGYLNPNTLGDWRGWAPPSPYIEPK